MRCTEVYYSKPGQHCESCGTPIHNCFVIEEDEGGSIIVGSECASTLVSDTTVAQYTRYAAKAARQWRKHEPASLADESREAYITRRIGELSRAQQAWQAWRAMATQDHFGRSHRNTARSRLVARGIRDPWEVRYAHRRIHEERDDSCALCMALMRELEAWPRLLVAEEHAMIAEVEQRYNANRADFVGVPGWRI